MSDAHASELGKASVYGGGIDAGRLFAMPRAPARAALGITGAPRFFGADLWTAYELSWLTPRGKPQVAIAHLTVPCESTHIIESKSLKLYLGGFAQTAFPDAAAVQQRIRTDLSAAIWSGGPMCGSVGVRLVLPEVFASEAVQELEGVNLDRLDLDCDRYTPAPDLLTAAFDEKPVTELLTSQLLKSNCLVTGQPDWASVQIAYSGPQIDQGGLLRYIVSFREHHEFHEPCVERIFTDVMARCRPVKLSVYARYTRRGGLDINPFRTSHPQALPPARRTARQ